jgi:glycosidase
MEVMMPGWPKNPIIYEINTWLWLDDLSKKYETPITLANVPWAEWDEIKKNGFDAVWLMGVWQRSPESIVISQLNNTLVESFKKALPDFKEEDNIGSAYCIRDYLVDERIGGNEGLAVSRADMANRGLLLMLDYVPNHVARDHAWVSQHPEYFIQGKVEDLLGSSGDFFEAKQKIIACGKDPYFPAWQDVAQLNVFHPDLRMAAARTLAQIATMCDGVRCDMAMLALNHVFSQTWGEKAGPTPEYEFWQEIIDAVHHDQPEFIFLAEAYWDLEWQLIHCGFDYCYDKRLYDRLLKNEGAEISAHLNADLNYQNHMVRFTENHDELRSAEVFETKKGILAAITVATIPGAKLFHEGQLEGRTVHTPVFLRRRVEEPIYTDKYRFYQQLIRTADSALVKYGDWSSCLITGWENHFSHNNLVAWEIHQDKNTLLVVINYSNTRSQGLVHLTINQLAGNTWRLVDLFKGDVYNRNGDEIVGPGLFVDLSPWDFHFLWFARPIN